jgi:hypothetical protein
MTNEQHATIALTSAQLLLDNLDALQGTPFFGQKAKSATKNAVKILEDYTNHFYDSRVGDEKLIDGGGRSKQLEKWYNFLDASIAVNWNIIDLSPDLQQEFQAKHIELLKEYNLVDD